MLVPLCHLCNTRILACATVKPKKTRLEASENKKATAGEQPTMIGRIDYTYEISVRSDSGGERVVVCSERCAGAADPGEGPTSYEFKGGEAAAKIGDLFLDCSGEIYRRIT